VNDNFFLIFGGQCLFFDVSFKDFGTLPFLCLTGCEQLARRGIGKMANVGGSSLEPLQSMFICRLITSFSRQKRFPVSRSKGVIIKRE
jgi:hypothetical protein